ncbi:MAG: hypothetical protein AAF609_03285 [Cyanobacteria bacterium P01_C01_bin.120]
MLDEIIDAIALIQNPEYRAKVHLAIAEQFNKNAEPRQALPYIEQAIEELSQLSAEDSTFWEYQVVEQLSKADQQARGEELLADLLERAKAETDPDVRNIELAEICAHYAEIGRFDRAIQLALEIEDWYYQFFRVFKSIAEIAVFKSNYAKVENILAVVEDSDDRDFILNESAGACAEHLQPAKALSLIERIINPSEKVNALESVFIHLVWRNADAEQFLALIKEVETFANTEMNPSVKAQALRIMAKQYGALNQFEQAKGLLDQAAAIAETISPDESKRSLSRDSVLESIRKFAAQLEQSSNRQESQSEQKFTKENQSTQESSKLTDEHSPIEWKQIEQIQKQAEQGFLDQAKVLAAQINDPLFKDFANRIVGAATENGDYLDDIVDDYLQVCHSVRQQNGMKSGISILLQILSQIASLKEHKSRPLLDRSIDVKSGKLSTLLIAIVEAYFQLRTAEER